MTADLRTMPFPVHVVPGNMDTGNKHTDRVGRHRGPDQCTDLDLNVTSAQLQQFASVVGPLWWSVDHKNVRFSGFADMVVNSGLAEEAAFWDWAETASATPESGAPRVDHALRDVCRPPTTSRTGTSRQHYLEWYFSVDQPGRGRLIDLFKATGASIVISGHVHCHKVWEAEGIRWEIAPATSFGQWGDRWPDGDDTLGFLRYDVTDEGIASTLRPPGQDLSARGLWPRRTSATPRARLLAGLGEIGDPA